LTHSAAPASLVTQSVTGFLKDVPPFVLLPAEELRALARHVSLDFFPRGAVILKAGGDPSESLYVIHKGAVRLTLTGDSGDNVLLDVRGEGDIFGVLSLMGGDIARFDVTAMEDTLAYSIPGERVRELTQRFPEVAAWVVRTSISRYVDRALVELRTRSQPTGGGEQLLYSVTAGEIATAGPVLCGEETSIQAVAEMMRQAKAGCAIVTNGDRRAVGIVTETDLAGKVVAEARSTADPVASIMTAPVVSIRDSEPTFQAMMHMLSRNIHHVLVTHDGLPSAVLTTHDLMLLQGRSPLVLSRDIDRQTTVEGVAAAQERILALIPLLIREGAKATHIGHVIAEINDHVVHKLVKIAEEKVGPPPCPYCWITLGSEGRREQTFKTDQDNGLIHADVPDEQRPSVYEYFRVLAKTASEYMARCGYPPCHGGYTAANARWRQPVDMWRSYFSEWITDPEQHTALHGLIFFDMRPVYGDFSLFEQVRAYVNTLLASAGFFKSILAYVSILHKPPLTLLRNFIVERNGEHKDSLDVKMHGTAPIVNLARLFAVDARIQETGTVERLTALREAGYAEAAMLNDLLEAGEFLMMLQLQHQVEQARAGVAVSNYVNPESLSHLQRALLKEAFQSIARAQAFAEARFKTAVWAQLQ
jgi:CBS domain-containing protein